MEDNFKEVTNEEEKFLTPNDRNLITAHLRLHIMWCYLHSLNFTQMDGYKIANLLIYTQWFVLEPRERPGWRDFLFSTLRKRCKYTFRKHQENKPTLPKDPEDIDEGLKRELTIQWPLKDPERLFEVIDILRKLYNFDTLSYKYYCPKLLLPEDPNDLSLEIECRNMLPITDVNMTRFNISLQGGVDMVMHALENAWGGELFVPKIPSYRILDVAEAIGPECEKPVVGIRP